MIDVRSSTMAQPFSPFFPQTTTQDPCAIRRAGFNLNSQDFGSMGTTIGELAPENIPLIVTQEGGYLMSAVGGAATQFLVSLCESRK